MHDPFRYFQIPHEVSIIAMLAAATGLFWNGETGSAVGILGVYALIRVAEEIRDLRVAMSPQNGSDE